MSFLGDDLKMLIAKRVLDADPACGTIYYIACPETRRLKIGFTSGRPEARLRALQTGSPTELRLMAIHPGTINDERYIHEQFGDTRIHGEWFEVDEHIFEFMAYVCWVAAVNARYRGNDTPHWAQVGLEAVGDELGPLPTDLGGRLQ